MATKVIVTVVFASLVVEEGISDTITVVQTA
jgi:hypothetical protein